MNIFQKLKIKLFGKERWRVVDSDEPVKVGDRRVCSNGSSFEVTSVCGSVLGIKCLLERRGGNCGASATWRKVK